MHDAGAVLGSGQQCRFGFTHTDTLEAMFVHGQVIEGVAGHQYFFDGDIQMVHQVEQGSALVDALGKHVEIAISGIEQIAAKILNQGLQGGINFIGVTEIGAATFLRHVLTLQRRADLLYCIADNMLARPDVVDVALNGLYRLQGLPIHNGATHIADNVLRCGNGGVRQKWQHGFEAASGDKDQVDIRVGGNQLIESGAVFFVAAQKSPVKIRC